MKDLGFNTVTVSVQVEKHDELTFFVGEFQYSDCVGSRNE